MTDSYYYYRCPCPSSECNGPACRYPTEMIPPVVSNFNLPSSSFFPKEHKLLNYVQRPKMEPINQHMPQPHRWTPPFGGIPERQAIKTEITQRPSSDLGRGNSTAQVNRPLTNTTQALTQTPANKTQTRTRRIRTAFTPFQLLCLETSFDKNHYVVGGERKQLASYLKLSETQVKVWFQNRRTKWKRQSLEGRIDLNKDPLTP